MLPAVSASIGKGPSWTFGTGGQLDCQKVSKPGSNPEMFAWCFAQPKVRCDLTALFRWHYPFSKLLHCMWGELLNRTHNCKKPPDSVWIGWIPQFIFPWGWHQSTTYHWVYSWGPFAYISTLAIKKWSPLVFPVPVLKLLQILFIQYMSLIICDLDRGTGGQFVRHQQPSEQTLQVTWCHGTTAALQKDFNSLGCHKDNPLVCQGQLPDILAFCCNQKICAWTWSN